jgi:hypothetical protein
MATALVLVRRWPAEIRGKFVQPLSYSVKGGIKKAAVDVQAHGAEACLEHPLVVLILTVVHRVASTARNTV